MRCLPALAVVLLLSVTQVACSSASSCKRPDAVSAELAEAKRYNQAHFEEALRERKLRPISLPSGTNTLTGAWDKRKEPGTVWQEQQGDRTVSLLAGPIVLGHGGEAGWELLEDNQGGIYQLVRKERVTKAKSYLLCGCGPVGSGMAPQEMQIIYNLPEGKTYRGEIKVVYDVQRIDTQYTHQTEDSRPCGNPP